MKGCWTSRLLLSQELGITPAELDEITRDLVLTSNDQRKLGSILILSPAICEVIAAIVEHDRKGASA